MQNFHGLAVQRFCRYIEFLRRIFQVMAQQHRYVLAPLAKRRCIDSNDIQPVIKIFAKAAFFDGLRQVLIGCSDDTDIYIN